MWKSLQMRIGKGGIFAFSLLQLFAVETVRSQEALVRPEAIYLNYCQSVVSRQQGQATSKQLRDWVGSVTRGMCDIGIVNENDFSRAAESLRVSLPVARLIFNIGQPPVPQLYRPSRGYSNLCRSRSDILNEIHNGILLSDFVQVDESNAYRDCSNFISNSLRLGGLSPAVFISSLEISRNVSSVSGGNVGSRDLMLRVESSISVGDFSGIIPVSGLRDCVVDVAPQSLEHSVDHNRQSAGLLVPVSPVEVVGIAPATSRVNIACNRQSAGEVSLLVAVTSAQSRARYASNTILLPPIDDLILARNPLVQLTAALQHSERNLAARITQVERQITEIETANRARQEIRQAPMIQSQDGQHLYYLSDRSWQSEIYVTARCGPTGSAGKTIFLYGYPSNEIIPESLSSGNIYQLASSGQSTAEAFVSGKIPPGWRFRFIVNRIDNMACMVNIYSDRQ